jgi:hypothetical protein
MPQTELMFISGPMFFFNPHFIVKNERRLSDCPHKNPDFGHQERAIPVYRFRADAQDGYWRKRIWKFLTL